jgi:cold-inducible RNA-binding protein
MEADPGKEALLLFVFILTVFFRSIGETPVNARSILRYRNSGMLVDIAARGATVSSFFLELVRLFRSGDWSAGIFLGSFRNPSYGNNLEGPLLLLGKFIHMENKLFVGNLSFDTSENDLQDAFSEHGEVTAVNIPQDRMTNKPRGFGFVTMATREGLQTAETAMNGRDLNGRALTVNEARPREERSGGGGGGARRSYGNGGGGGGSRGGYASNNRY